MEDWLLPLIFAVIAFLYSTAGFGGGSGYLAVLVLFGTGFIETRFISLACNLLVVSGSTWVYFRSGLFDRKKILPLVILSVPMAWLGGMIKISENAFFLLLGISLILAGPAMVFRSGNKLKTDFGRSNSYLNALLGGGIGFLSGLVGIGGGIFLAPLLYLMRWDRPAKIAAASGFFILVNSAAGLAGQMSNARFQADPVLLISCLAAVLAGGQAGVRISVRNLSPRHLQWITAILVVFVGTRILLKSFWE